MYAIRMFDKLSMVFKSLRITSCDHIIKTSERVLVRSYAGSTENNDKISDHFVLGKNQYRS